MKYVNSYDKFLEKRNVNKSLEMLVEQFGMLLEADESVKAAPAEVQSEKEIISEMPEDQKNKIEDIIGKFFPEAKGKVDLDKPTEEPKGETPKEGDKPEGEEGVEKTNEEGGILLAITIASLIPACMEAIGSFSNFLKQKFGINLDEKQMVNVKKMNEAITALNKIKAGKEGKFMGKLYNAENFKEISNLLSKELGNPELEFGKGYDDGHGHGDKKEESKPEGEQIKEAQEESSASKLNKFDDTINKEIAKYKKFRDKSFGSSFGNWMKEKGHALHHAYTAPIRGILFGISKVSKPTSKLRDEKVREKVANVLYSIAMIGLAGYGIVSTLGHLAGVSEVTQILLKGTEAGLNLGEVRKQALTAIIGAAA